MKSCCLTLALLFMAALPCLSQQSPNEHVFSQPPAQVKKALLNLPGGKSGPLPTLEGFVASNLQGPETYQRPFYQCQVRVLSNSTGGALVRVTAQITAWHDDGGHSGYVLLKSSGRLEADLIDRLRKVLEQPGDASAEAVIQPLKTADPAAASKPQGTEISAPTSQFPKHPQWTPPQTSGSQPTTDAALEQEARNLEDILRNQAHPTNLVAIKKDQTPVLQDSSLDARILFVASAQDEFEVLETTPDWVHVRISGLSRGWVRKSSVQMLDSSSEYEPAQVESNSATPTTSTPSTLFNISNDEVGSFPGDWPSLKGKNVKIVSVQQAAGTGRITSPQDKLRFAQSIFQKEDATSSSGLVVIFDSEDGGMIAALNSSIDQWKKRLISESDFWKKCYIDPPELLGSTK